jgi:hypothetical protein
MDRQVGIFSIVGVLILSSKKLCLDINTGELPKKKKIHHLKKKKVLGIDN